MSNLFRRAEITLTPTLSRSTGRGGRAVPGYSRASRNQHLLKAIVRHGTRTHASAQLRTGLVRPRGDRYARSGEGCCSMFGQ